MALLELQQVTYTPEQKPVLGELSLTVNSGDFISVVGPSGSGKSSLLKLCCNLISPTRGKISYNGTKMDEYNPVELRRNLMYCFQTPHLFGDTVLDNIAFPFQIRNMETDIAGVEQLFSLLNLEMEYLYRKVENLSGGEKQRIALIRALLFKPQVLLLDEVTSALDVENANIVEQAILSFHTAGTTILWITHDPAQSRKYANKLLTLENGFLKSLEVLR